MQQQYFGKKYLFVSILCFETASVTRALQGRVLWYNYRLDFIQETCQLVLIKKKYFDNKYFGFVLVCFDRNDFYFIS